MSGLSIIGTGHYVPGRPYSNQDLARVLDTNDEWIRQRTGIAQRYFCPEGQGVSDLALHASRRALESAGVRRLQPAKSGDVFRAAGFQGQHDLREIEALHFRQLLGGAILVLAFGPQA